METKRMTQIIPFFFILVISLLQKTASSRPSITRHQKDSCRPIDHHALRSDQLTVLINGFSELHLPLLQELATIYSSSPAVHSVYVLWGNPSTPSGTLRNLSFPSLGIPIYLLRDPNASLNNRFLPRPFICTRAVAVCDDDIRIDVDSFRFAFQVWQSHPERIVGFFARSHEFDLSQRSWIYTMSSNRFSIILTKFMVVSVDYLREYSCQISTRVRELVDERRKCKDIAMKSEAYASTPRGLCLAS